MFFIPTESFTMFEIETTIFYIAITVKNIDFVEIVIINFFTVNVAISAIKKLLVF